MKQNNGSPYKPFNPPKNRRLLISSGDILLPRNQKIRPSNRSKEIRQNYHSKSQKIDENSDKIKTDKFTAFKEQFEVPTISSGSLGKNVMNKKHNGSLRQSVDIRSPMLSYHMISQKNAKKKLRLKSLQMESRNKQHRYHTIGAQDNFLTINKNIQGRYRLKSNLRSGTLGIEDNYDRYVRRQLCSIDLGDLKETPVIDRFDPKYLTQYEREQIKMFKNVYYIGHKAYQRKHTKEKFNDAKNNYKPLIGDHIGYRFEIIKILGSGAFGKVLQVFDHKSKKTYALKILKQSEDLYQQFQLQVEILKLASQHASANKNIIQIKGDFQFRGHICIVMEMLSLNLYSFLKGQNYEGLELQVIRKILIQILQALAFLHHRNIIHCDIKLENIVFREMGKSGIKVIDFGSACFYNKKQFTYIQSRYYRAPEIVLIKPYDNKIDIWSLGCVLFQLFTGAPLFPSRNQTQQMGMLNATLGQPSQKFLKQCERGDQFKFEKKANAELSLKNRLKCENADFTNLIQQMVKWSPEQRIQAVEALKHPFIVDGLPKQVRQEHIKQMNSENPYNLFA